MERQISRRSFLKTNAVALGSSPTTAMCHSGSVQCKVVDWLKKVSDEQYRK